MLVMAFVVCHLRILLFGLKYKRFRGCPSVKEKSDIGIYCTVGGLQNIGNIFTIIFLNLGCSNLCHNVLMTL